MTQTGYPLLWSLLISAQINLEQENNDSYNYVSNLSKYEGVRGNLSRTHFVSLERCNPIRYWIFHRHGTRFPGTDEIESIQTLISVRDKIIGNHKQGRGSLTAEQIKRLEDWTFDESIHTTPMYLTQEGYNETLRTSLRFKERFTTLLNKKYTEKDFYFQHSDTQRTLVTSHAFINGLFGEGSHLNVSNIVLPLDKDLLLYNNGGACPKFSQLLSDDKTYFQQTSFLKSNDVLKAIEKISWRLGFTDTLTTTNLTAMFAACGYDSAWYQEFDSKGTWCDALGTEGREIGEYYFDLVFQGYAGYGNEITERVGCAGPKDLWERFATAVGELELANKNESVVGLFSHDNVIMSLYTSLGLFKDDPPLRGDNYQVHKERLWRISNITPFAGNFAAILHECQDEDEKTEHKVMFLKNEHYLEGIPQCPSGICTWDNFRNFIKPVADMCDFEEFC